MDCSLPGSSVHGILQARILEWIAVSFWGSSRTRDWTWVSSIAGRFFTTEPPGKPWLVILILHNFRTCMFSPLLEWEQKVGYVLYIIIFLIWRIGVIWWSWKGRLLILQKRVCFKLPLSNGGNVFKFINIFSPSPNAYHGAKSTGCGLGTERS